jgi:alpha-galactosidase
MGWNSWNHFNCAGLNETVVENTALAMATNGMKAAGYQYINLDDCWQGIHVTGQGALVTDPTKFPHGMPALVSYVHSLGLKIGIYEDVGTETCEDMPGSYGHYDQVAQQFVSWGMDYVKMDYCHTTGEDPKALYTQFAQSLANANSHMVFSICDWGNGLVWEWAPQLSNSWRTTPDIYDSWLSMITNLDATSAFAASASPGAWNDPDMLEVGNGGMTPTEDQTQFSMWAILAAPLIAGNDLTKMTAKTLATLTNPEVIAVDQDALGKQGLLLSDHGNGLQVWSRQVMGGTVVALLNQSKSPASITVNWSDIGLQSEQSAAVRDLWARADLGASVGSFTANVSSHAVTLLKIGASGTAPSQTVYEADAQADTLTGEVVVQPCPNHNGYSCLDGNNVTGLGDGASNSIVMNDVKAPSSGPYNMTVYAEVKGTETFFISVNRATPTQLTVTGYTTTIPVATGMRVQLNAGANSIEFSNPIADAPDLDHIVISAPVNEAEGFNIVYPTSNVSITAPGQSGSTSIALVSTGNFVGNVQINCVVPVAMLGATCAAQSISLSGTGSASTQLAIATTAPFSASLSQIRSLSDGDPLRVAKPHDAHSMRAARDRRTALLGLLLPFPTVALMGLGLRRRSCMKRALSTLLLLFVASASVTQIAACRAGAPTCMAVPAAPVGLTALSIMETSTNLSWTPATAPANCSISSYALYQNDQLIASSIGTSYSFTGLSPSTAYNFTVVATDSAGTSTASPLLVVKTLAPPPSTPAGTYAVTVTASSGSLSQATTIQVTVL